jgi:AraC-like DNA-binding protein
MQLKTTALGSFAENRRLELYTAIVIPGGTGICHIDSGTYPFSGPSVLFLAPFQTLRISGASRVTGEVLQFHGDFYCIEFHKPEVACNGLLFNNVYLSPVLTVSRNELAQIQELLRSVRAELNLAHQDGSILISYLQLFLALCSRIKRGQIEQGSLSSGKDDEMERLKVLIDAHFLTKRRPFEYAKLLNLTTTSLARRCRKYFAKSPSQLIQERTVLEAKKRLHLTRQSVKEIAFALFRRRALLQPFFQEGLRRVAAGLSEEERDLPRGRFVHLISGSVHGARPGRFAFSSHDATLPEMARRSATLLHPPRPNRHFCSHGMDRRAQVRSL